MRVRLLAVAAVLLAGFVALGLLVRERPPEPDAAVADALHGQWQRPLGAITEVVTTIFGPALPVAGMVALIVAIVLATRRGHTERAALLCRCALVGVACRLTSLFKPAFERERPREYPMMSYPSGHVVSVGSVAFVVVLLCLLRARHRLWLAVAASTGAVLLSALSRIVLGVHWLTDTLGSVLAVLGVGLLASVAVRLQPASPHGAGVVSSKA
ncbi:MAG: phosphatase PAP2 family protein [Pseudonocardiaceae bacterium]|nr:phosphatase PAP2 family protein [Pseudonocardiaceae bacterium]